MYHSLLYQYYRTRTTMSRYLDLGQFDGAGEWQGRGSRQRKSRPPLVLRLLRLPVDHHWLRRLLLGQTVEKYLGSKADGDFFVFVIQGLLFP